jgi:putative ABC transport system ATP-binding protein
MSRLLVRAQGITRTFTTRAGTVEAVRDVTLEVAEGELVVVRGRSGAGKTTLLGLLAGVDRPTSGTVEQTDVAVPVGYVMQTFGLIDVLSATENVEIPLRLDRTDPSERTTRVAEALAAVGLEKHGHQRPGELSGGQRQRVAIARALVTAPRLLIADEPTGQLDSTTAGKVMDLLHGLTRQTGAGAVVATHDPGVVARADRVLDLHDGHLTAAH